MRVKVDQDLCISCGTCIDICPDVFNWNEEEKAQAFVEKVPEKAENDVQEAMENCPTYAISEQS